MPQTPHPIPDREHVLAEVTKLLCRGLDRDTILAYASEHGWPESPTQIDALVDAAGLALAEDAALIDPTAELAKAVGRLNHLYMSALKVQDLRTALAVQKELNKMLKLQLARDAARPASASEPPKAKLTIVR